MRIVPILLLCGLLWAPLAAWAQGKKPEAAVGRVVTLGEIGEGEKRFIYTSLQAGLSQKYEMVSQSDYDRAEALAFSELGSNQCTEEQCIRKIQELLQVDRLFVLQIIREQTYTQVSLTLARGPEKIVRARRCQACDIGKLDDAVAGLVAEVTAADVGTARPVAAPWAAAPPEPERKEQPRAGEAQPFVQTWVVGVGAGAHRFSGTDAARAQSSQADAISSGALIQVYGEYYPAFALGVGMRIYGVTGTRTLPGTAPQLTETVSVSNVLLTGNYIFAERTPHMMMSSWSVLFGALAGVGSSTYTLRKTQGQVSTALDEDTVSGNALLLGAYADWGGRAFGLRAGLNLLRTSYARKLFNRYSVEGSGAALAIDARWAF